MRNVIDVGQRYASVCDTARPTGVRVLVVADCDLMSLGLRALMARAPWVGNCSIARDYQAASSQAARELPDVIVVDLDRADCSGAGLTAALRRIMPSAPVVLLSAGPIASAVVRRCGAAAVLSKHTALDQLATVVRSVVAGGTYVGTTDVSHDLSPRECDVLALMIQGATNVEIAERLCLSRYTIKQHAAGIYRKLEVRNRTEAVTRAGELGLTGLPLSYAINA